MTAKSEVKFIFIFILAGAVQTVPAVFYCSKDYCLKCTVLLTFLIVSFINMLKGEYISQAFFAYLVFTRLYAIFSLECHKASDNNW